MSNIVVRDGQSLVDVALENYGCVEGAWWLCEDNAIEDVTKVPAAGSVLILRNNIDINKKNLRIKEVVDFKKLKFNKNHNATLDVDIYADLDYKAWQLATGVVVPPHKAVVAQAVYDLKLNDLWTSARVLKPYIGGTATMHKFNLKSPLDSDAAFRDVYFGGVVHGTYGVSGNGINARVETYLNPNVTLPGDRTYVFKYVNGGTDMAVFGAVDVNTKGDAYHASAFGATLWNLGDAAGSGSVALQGDGIIVMTRQGGVKRLYKNGVLVSTVSSASNAVYNFAINLLCRRFDIAGFDRYNSGRIEFFGAWNTFFSDAMALKITEIVNNIGNGR